MTWFHAARARLRLLAPRAAESRIDERHRLVQRFVARPQARLPDARQVPRPHGHRRPGDGVRIWFGAVTFQMFGTLTSTALPLPDGDRIVRIQNWDVKTLKDEDRVLYDYQLWRSAVVSGVMAARKITRGLGTRLRAGTAGGGGVSFGVWTAVIVTQVLVAYAILMLGVCTLACVVPTLRALRVQPTEALRAE